jgi:pimeloyl-ACP methyl ester carboxylesterase
VNVGGRVYTVDSFPALKTARCGYLVVPENRSRPTGRTIRLAVAIVPPMSQTPAPDPVVPLSGGPGGSAISDGPGLIKAGLNRDRELILMDQRGSLGFSKPRLSCPESARFVARRVGLVYDAASTGRRQAAAVRACHRRLVGRGIDLGAYNTTESAADFADLRAALGFQRWNLYGLSYGTDLALTLMREHPDGIRSVTLDSVVPPHSVTLGGFWDNARRGFNNLFAACAAQRRCHRRHPQLRRTFTRLVRKLESHPLTTRVRPTPDAPRVKVVLDGGALTNWLVLMGNRRGSRRSLPPRARAAACHGARRASPHALLPRGCPRRADRLSWGHQLRPVGRRRRSPRALRHRQRDDRRRGLGPSGGRAGVTEITMPPLSDSTEDGTLVR